MLTPGGGDDTDYLIERRCQFETMATTMSWEEVIKTVEVGSEPDSKVLDATVFMMKKLHLPRLAIYWSDFSDFADGWDAIGSSRYADGNLFAPPLAVAARVIERINDVHQAKLAVDQAVAQAQAHQSAQAAHAPANTMNSGSVASVASSPPPHRDSRLRKRREDEAVELQGGYNDCSALEVAESLGDLKKSADVDKLKVNGFVSVGLVPEWGIEHVHEDCMQDQIFWDLLWVDTEAARNSTPMRFPFVYVEFAEPKCFAEWMSPSMVGGKEKFDLELQVQCDETKTITQIGREVDQMRAPRKAFRQWRHYTSVFWRWCVVAIACCQWDMPSALWGSVWGVSVSA